MPNTHNPLTTPTPSPPEITPAQHTLPPNPTPLIRQPNLPNPFTNNAPPNQQTGITTMTTPHTNFITTCSLLPTPHLTLQHNTNHPPSPTINPPMPTQQTLQDTTITCNADNNVTAQVEQAFVYELMPPQPMQPTPIPQQTAQPAQDINSPLYTMLNLYSRGNSIINYSQEYTERELDTIQLAEQAHYNTQASLQMATLNSLRASGCTMTTNITTPHPTHTTRTNYTSDNCPTPTATPINIIHTNNQGDTDPSTITGIGDDTTPSSRSTVSHHPAIITGTHNGALHTL